MCSHTIVMYMYCSSIPEKPSSTSMTLGITIDVIYVPIALLYGYVQIPKPEFGYDRSTLSTWWLISKVRFKAAHTFLITFKLGDSGGF